MPKHLGGFIFMIIKHCLVCGKEFKTFPSRIKNNLGKYCSKKCGIGTYFKKGHIPIAGFKKGIYQGFGFKKGHIPWNLDKIHSKETRNKISKAVKGKMINEKHPAWKGDDVTYVPLHTWVARKLGKPTKCKHCGKDGLTGRFIHWANLSGKYKRDLSDWIRLCNSCHQKFDNQQKLLT